MTQIRILTEVTNNLHHPSYTSEFPHNRNKTGVQKNIIEKKLLKQPTLKYINWTLKLQPNKQPQGKFQPKMG